MAIRKEERKKREGTPEQKWTLEDEEARGRQQGWTSGLNVEANHSIRLHQESKSHLGLTRYYDGGPDCKTINTDTQ